MPNHHHPDQHPQAAPQANHVRAPHSQRERLDHLLNVYHTNQPTGGTPEFRDRINEVFEKFDQFRDPTKREVSDALNKVFGEIVRLGKPKDLEDRAIRAHALEFLKEMKEVFALPDAHQATPRDLTLGNLLHSLTEAGNPSELIRFLITSLSPTSGTIWNSVNLVTGLFNLGRIDPAWPHSTLGLALAEAFTQSLTKVAATDCFSSHTVCNLFAVLPRVLEALERCHPARPIVQTSLLKAASRAFDGLKETPDLEYIKSSFLFPLRQLKTHNLTPEAGIAANALVARVADLLFKVKGSESLEIVSMTFHSMHGITSWTRDLDSQSRLAHILHVLNNRLELNTTPVTSIEVGSILYGLKGIDHETLNEDSAPEVSRTYTILSAKIRALPPDERFDARCLSAAFHGLAVALTQKSGPVAQATGEVVAALEARIPVSVEQFEDLGQIASALIPLSTSRSSRIRVVKALFECVERSARSTLKMNNDTIADLISWQTINQMYALYSVNLPAALAFVLSTLDSSVQRSIHTSASERRIGEWIRDDFNLSFLPTPFQDGFQFDLALSVPSPSGAKIFVNIEVDGPHHREPVQKILDSIRDAHLEKKGWRVVRIPTDTPREEVRSITNMLLKSSLRPPGPSTRS